MKTIRRTFLAVYTLLALVTSVSAQEPSDLFLRAYQDFQAGEKAERDGNPREALAKYETTAKLLNEIVRADATWQPPVVEYRLKKTRENIDRLTAEVARLPAVDEGPEGPMPQAEPSVSIPAPAVNTSSPLSPTRPPAARATPPPSVAGSEASLLRRQLSDARKENERLQERLASQAAELKSALVAVDRTKVTVVELKAQLAQQQDAFEDAKKDNQKPDPAVQDGRLKELADRVSAIEIENEVLIDENTRLVAKLERAAKYIEGADDARKSIEADRSQVAKQRDEAINRTKKIKDNTEALEKLAQEKKELQAKLANNTDAEKLEKLASENKALSEKLTETETKLAEALKKPEENAQALETLRSEINGLNDRLLEAYAQVSSRDEQVKALAKQLDETSGDLARMKLNPEPNAEDKRVIAENDLLRAIILRQIKEQALRDAARTSLEQEIQSLQIKSEKISEDLGVLAKPAFKLTDDEQRLFNEPVALLAESSPAALDVSVAVVQPSGNDPQPIPQGAESLPDATRASVEEARKLFELGRFSDAEKLYQQIVEAAPDNYFALSNLGVTQIQARKLSAAEVALKKAITINPEDSFAATNLGIVYCKQGRFDDAVDVLREAITADEKDYVAHNYLGVSLGEKGLKGEAEDQLKRSIAIKDDYADAHFNLAVLYATAEPPAMELARQHYKKAVSHGATPDPSLERLIQ